MDAVYRCFKKRDCVEAVLSNFFESGGTSVFLSSDCGDDFSNLTSKFPIIYEYDTEKVHSGRGGWGSVKGKHTGLKWLEFFKRGLDAATSDYVILLEDDVKFRGPLSSIPIDYEITGPEKYAWNTYSPDERKFINKYAKVPNNYVYFGGIGGTIFNRKIFLDNYTFIYEFLDDHYKESLQYLSSPENWPSNIPHSRFQFSDVFISTAYNILGFEYGANREFTEAHFDEDYLTNGKLIVHGINPLTSIRT